VRSGEVTPKGAPADLVVGVAVSTFNEAITDRLLAGCLETLRLLGVGEVKVLRVPGAWELPGGAQALLARGCDAVVAVGAVIKGETDHYEVIVRESAAGLMRVSLDFSRPVGNAVLAVHDYQQALERSEMGPGNKAAEAAEATIGLALLVAGLGN
jgi:6,7-dimethyl-8-ribityllumazine synthase